MHCTHCAKHTTSTTSIGRPAHMPSRQAFETAERLNKENQ